MFINVLYQRNQIDKDQIQNIIQAAIKEVLFDCLINKKQSSQIKVIFETKGNQMGAILNSTLFNNPITYLDYSKNIDRLKSLVVDWNNRDISDLSPNLAPVIKDIDKLKKAVANSNTYQQLFIFIDGKKTIRDLAIASKQDVIDIVDRLSPHIQSKAIALQEIPDLQLANLYFSPSSQQIDAGYASPKRDYVREIDLPLVIIVSIAIRRFVNT